MFKHYCWPVVALIATSISWSGAFAQERVKALDRDALVALQEAARELSREIEVLQLDIADELAGQKERTLYRQAEGALAAAIEFQQALKPGASHQQLLKDFEPLDRKVHELLEAVRAQGSKPRALQRAAIRVGTADEAMHFALSAGDASDDGSALIIRQARALAAATRLLDQTGEYALGVTQGRAVLVQDFHKLAKATEEFQKGLSDRKDQEQRQQDFAAVKQAWHKVCAGLRDLPSREQLLVLRLAARVDVLHGRLFDLLGLKGDRPRLIIRT